MRAIERGSIAALLGSHPANFPFFVDEAIEQEANFPASREQTSDLGP
jgi:hypothetical protein